MILLKRLYDELVKKINIIVAREFVLKTQYNTGKSDQGKKT